MLIIKIMKEVLISVFGSIILIIAGVLAKNIFERKKILRDKKEQELRIKNLEKELSNQITKTSVSDEIIKMIIYNSLKDSVTELFKNTKVDRFLVLIARNGETDPKFVDVFLDWYQKPEEEIDAVKIYKNVPIDNPYVEMLHKTFHQGFFDIETAVMEEQILKHYYETEKVYHSRTNPIGKEYLDKGKALLIFTSSATHDKEPFSESEKSQINLYVNGQIKPALIKLLGIKNKY